MDKKPNNRIHYIDSMKGLAALSVFSWHYILFIGSIYYPLEQFQAHDITRFLIDGCVAVCVFILLSGFSNALSLGIKELNTTALRDAVVKRYLRLAIPIVPIIFIVACMRWLGLMYNYEFADYSKLNTITQCYNINTMPYLVLRMFKAFFCSPIGDVTGIDLPLWMLKYVFLGSYIIMLLYVMTYKMKLITKLLIIAFASFLTGYLISMYYIPAIIGLAFYFLYPYFCKGQYFLSFLALILAIISYCYLPELPFPLNGVLTSIFVVLFVMCNPLLQKALEIPFFKWLGKVSFMLYLVHMPIICSLSCWLCINLPVENLLIKTLPVYVITLLISLLFAHLFTLWIEEKLSKIVISMIMKKLPKITEIV